MSTMNSKEGVRRAAIVLPFFYGVVGEIVLFVAGSWSGSGTYAIIATCLLFLIGASWFAKRFPTRWPFIGILMNLPPWLFFIFLAEAGQFDAFFWGLVACLGSAYLGVFVGRWGSTLRPRSYKRVFALGLSAAVVLLVIFFVVVRRPTPIRGNKQAFIGHWKSVSGYELQIDSNGTARILNNGVGDPVLKIEVGPSTIEGLRVRFVGDTILEVIRPSFYGKSYVIGSNPYLDSSAYVMTLNGITLRREF